MADSLYDYEKAMSYQSIVVKLAEVNGLNLLEMYKALSPIVAVCQSAIKTSLTDAAKSHEGKSQADKPAKKAKRKKKAE